MELNVFASGVFERTSGVVMPPTKKWGVRIPQKKRLFSEVRATLEP